jgi:putative ABC transport system permease protein
VSTPAPPRLPEKLLEATLESTDREAVLGDLHEEYLARASGSRAIGAGAWYWCEALRLASRFALRRLARRARGDAPIDPLVAARGPFMSSLAVDVRYALRAIRRQPGVSLVVAITLALGLGVNATVLGMMDALLLRPFQFRDYQRLVVLWEHARGASEREMVAPANFLDWQVQARSVEQLAAWQWSDATLTVAGEPERVQGFRVSHGFFELFGVAPALGRTFARDDQRRGNHRRVVISDGLWKRRFGQDPDVVGSEVLVDGEAYTIVGVAPPRFAFPVGCELWVPLALTSAQAVNREDRNLTVAGKLAGGQSVAAAQAEMDLVARRLEAEYPQTNRERRVEVRPLSTAFREGSTIPFVVVLQVAAGLVLLVACANVAGLLLARAIDRQRELALRTALGASRMRIVRQLVTEAVVLGLLASSLAVLVAGVGLDLLRASLPAETARFVEGWDNLRLDGRLAVLMPALAIGVGLLVGLFPAMAATRAPLMEASREGDRGAGHRRQRGRQALVVVEIASALAILIAAGLTLAGGVRLVNQPGGFDAQGVLTLQIPLPDSKYHEPDSRREFFRDLLERVEAIPTVERAALANVVPGAGWNPALPLVVEHQPLPDPARRPHAGHRAVSAGYFDVMRIPIVRGRAFSSLDREGGQPVAIVSASLAERYWPGQDPTGRRLRLDGPNSEWLTIVGVVGDVRMYNWWDGEDFVVVYVPLRQAPPVGLVHAVLRTQVEPGSLTGSIREAAKAVDPLLPVSAVRTMRQAVADSSAGLHHMALLMGVCGAIGLALALVGIYSVMSYAISQRTYEFGIRMALGARAPDVLRITLSQAGALTGLGLALGSLLALAFGRLLSSALYGVVSLQVMPFVGIGLGLGVVSLAAACLPARRTLRIDPATILRGQ